MVNHHLKLEEAVKQVMLYVMVADGIIESAELTVIQDIYHQMTDGYLDEAAISEAIAGIRVSAGCEFLEALRELALELPDAEKEIILKAGFLVAFSDADFDITEKKVLTEIMGVLQIPEDRIPDLMEEVTLIRLPQN